MFLKTVVLKNFVCNFIKKESPTQVCSYEFYENCKNTSFSPKFACCARVIIGLEWL